MCYICREEEHHDRTPTVHSIIQLRLNYDTYSEPSEPPVAWVHPCNCTLIAHESCLLSWIQSSQQDSARAQNALKCPQCGTIYELESDTPQSLRILNSINGFVSSVGKLFTVGGISIGILASGFGSYPITRHASELRWHVLVSTLGIYIILTSYGAFAVQEFLGREMCATSLVS